MHLSPIEKRGFSLSLEIIRAQKDIVVYLGEGGELNSA